jgi:O-antigen ligase
MNTATPVHAAPPFLRSAESWQLIFLLIMLASGFLSIAVSQLALGSALFALLYRWIIRRQLPPMTGLEPTAALLALWALAMIPFSTDIAQSAIFYRRFYLFTAIWVSASVTTTERRRLLMLCFLLGGALSSSLYDIFRHTGEHGAPFGQRMAGIFNSMTGGAMLMMATLVTAGFLLTPGVNRRIKMMMTVAALPMILAVVMTMTRSAGLGLLAGVGLMVLFARPRMFGIFLIAVSALAVLVFLFGENLMSAGMWSRLDPKVVMTSQEFVWRREMWRGGLEMVKAHPLTGLGDRGLEELSRAYYVSAEGAYFGHLHSNIVHMAAIWGIPGLIFGQAFIFAGLWFLTKCWRALRRQPDKLRASPMAAGWVLGAVGVWAGFYVAGLTEWYFGDAEPMLIYLAILGCALGSANAVLRPGAAARRIP